MLIAHRSLRLLTCLLVAGLDLTRMTHASHFEPAPTNGATAAGSHHNTDPHDHPADSLPSHDSDDCQICHFIATGSAAIAAARSVVVSAAPSIDRRRPPAVIEPHSADIDLPCAARAPPFPIHAA